MLSFWPAFLTALAVVGWLTPIVIKLAHNKGWLDDPQKTKREKNTHTWPVPRLGGVSIGLAIIATSLMFIPLDQKTIGVLVGVGLVVLVGVLDDLYDLNPYLRFGMNILIAGLVVGFGIGIAFINNPLTAGVLYLDQPRLIIEWWGKTREIWILADILAVFWLVWTMNMVNWSKGVPGQQPGVVVIASLIIGAVAVGFLPDPDQVRVVYLAMITAGAYLGFLYYNFLPQRIMPGYSAGALGGFMLGVMAIFSSAKIATAVLVLAIPTVDAVYAIARRLKNKRSPFWGDRGHFHHLLIDRGMPIHRVAIAYWIFSLVLGLLALGLNTRQKFFTIIFVALLFISVVIWLKFFTTSLRQLDRSNG